MKRWLLATALLWGAPLAAQTHADTLDARCIWWKLDSLTWVSPPGQRKQLANAGKTCNASWLARPSPVDTVIKVKVDTVVKTDTVFVPSKPPVDTVTPAPPIVLPPVADTTMLGKLLGPYLTSAQQIALGEPMATFDRQFAQFDEAQWAGYVSGAFTPDYFNYYDRALEYYARHFQTGEAKYRLRADSLARDYRKRYIEANGYQPAWNNQMSTGLAVHYVVTGDTMSRFAVGQLGDEFGWYPSLSSTDNRVQAYVLKALLDAWIIKAPSVGLKAGIPPTGDWAVALRSKLTTILGTQEADGAWRRTDCGDGGPKTVHPFTTGLLLDQLARYYDVFERDARIPTAVKKGADYLWANDWVSTANAFKYVERVCPSEGGPTPAPILNGLLVNAYSWIYARTGDATYRTRAIAMIAGTAASGEAGTNPKQFNQQYHATWRALYWMK